MMSKNGLRASGVALLMALLFSTHAGSALAGVMLGGTRVIVNEKDREASIPVKNTGTTPYVVQAWIDAGEGKNKTPFLVTPPLSRLDPGMENILRILRVSNELPQDRESVFWLNVKEIPETAQQENVLQIAVRTRIKLFYRPAALRGGDPSAAREQLKWAVVAGDDGKGPMLKIVNPTPYNVTFTALRINNGQQEINPDMLPPHGEQRYPLTAIKTPQTVSVGFTTINDYGGETPAETIQVPATETPISVQSQPVANPNQRP